jgi:hypothetical protein
MSDAIGVAFHISQVRRLERVITWPTPTRDDLRRRLSYWKAGRKSQMLRDPDVALSA